MEGIWDSRNLAFQWIIRHRHSARAARATTQREKKRTTMSRSALWRQEANVQERERQADDAFLEAVETGKVSLV